MFLLRHIQTVCLIQCKVLDFKGFSLFLEEILTVLTGKIYAILQPFVKKCTPLEGETDLSLKSI